MKRPLFRRLVWLADGSVPVRNYSGRDGGWGLQSVGPERLAGDWVGVRGSGWRGCAGAECPDSGGAGAGRYQARGCGASAAGYP